MVSRRRFLGYSLAGMISAAAGCRPTNFAQQRNTTDATDESNNLLVYKKDLEARKKYFLGYPLNMNTPSDEFFNWRRELQSMGIGRFGYNNVGNPFAHSGIAYNTHDLEKELILRFGSIYGFPKDDIWGFLSHSGTDSNMHGMYIGRTILKGRTGIVPKCYFTEEAHYSIQILGDLLGLDRVFVRTLPDASMDPEDLKLKLAENPNSPALVVATIGTTFKGAVDKVDRIQEVLKGRTSYLHLDAALFGGYLPHTKGANLVTLRNDDQANNYCYDSIAVSCHKFFGFPSPAGLFITPEKRQLEFNKYYSTIHNPEYIGQVPGTITCSRDAVKPGEFYYFSTPKAIERQSCDAGKVLSNTSVLLKEMKDRLPHLEASRTNELSNTIYFRCPCDEIIKKYSLATMHLAQDGYYHKYAHVVIMPHVNQNVLDEFLADLHVNKTIEI